MKNGAEDYVTKPVNYPDLLATIQRGLEKQRLKSEVGRLEEIVDALANAIESLDPYTRGHSDRVSRYCLRIADAMGLDEEQLTLLKRAAKLHDVGKLGIDKRILRKPGPLTPEEIDEIRQHPDHGNRILMPFPTLQDVRECVYEHHERWDGQGYPRRIGGAEISLCGRILSLVEVFDALATQRSYKEAWPLSRTIRYLREHGGKAFDPELANRFADILKREGDELVIPTGPYSPSSA
jgi:HD-GYP domain-containing protein (c-di-GMP phosphodiesterase class II)